VSQFYFQQAYNNVIHGPWKKIAEGYGKMVLGYFGQTPVPADPEIVKIAAEALKLEPTTKTAMEIDDADPKKGLGAARKMLEAEKLPVTDENLFIVASCKDKGILYLKGEARVNVRKKDPAAAAPAAAGAKASSYTVTVSGTPYTVSFDGDRASVNGRSYDVKVEAGGSAPATGQAPAKASGETSTVAAALPGLIVRIPAKVGDSVKPGDVLVVMEAMKMEMNIEAVSAGTVSAIKVKPGDQVTPGTEMVVLN